MIFFGSVAGMTLMLPLMIAMFDSQEYYLPFGIGMVIGIIGAFLLAYALRFHT